MDGGKCVLGDARGVRADEAADVEREGDIHRARRRAGKRGTTRAGARGDARRVARRFGRARMGWGDGEGFSSSFRAVGTVVAGDGTAWTSSRAVSVVTRGVRWVASHAAAARVRTSTTGARGGGFVGFGAEWTWG